MKMIRPSIILSLMIFNGLLAFGQSAGIYTLHLTDKKGSLYTLDHPEAFLSDRSLQRREREHIPVTMEDLPVSQAYLDTLRSLGAEIYSRSKWFNTVTVHITDPSLPDTLRKLTFVDSIRLVKPETTRKSLLKKWQTDGVEEDTPDYLQQLAMLNGLSLHDHGFRGKGVLIAVLDAGFYHVNELPAFDSLRAAGRILGTRDMVARNDNVWDDHTHGMNVLSILAGILPGSLIGAAPDASYWLIRTEDVFSEYPVEEEYWLAGAELADSVGADIITSSLGYFLFDDPRFNHTYADMNGRTTVAARAAVMAARRGIIVVNSAGNEGNKPWHYIITPADADSILAVGAVTTSLQPASFTSFGPASDGRVKPDVAALGVGVYVQVPDGTVSRGSGTSFSAPLISGMTACLRQAFPDKPAQEIIRAIRASSSRFTHPDSLVGYGIPDMETAYESIYFTEKLESRNKPLVFPNPFTSGITIALSSEKEEDVTVTIYNTMGSEVLSQDARLYPGINILKIRLATLSAGAYILKTRYNGRSVTQTIVKIK